MGRWLQEVSAAAPNRAAGDGRVPGQKPRVAVWQRVEAACSNPSAVFCYSDPTMVKSTVSRWKPAWSALRPPSASSVQKNMGAASGLGIVAFSICLACTPASNDHGLDAITISGSTWYGHVPTLFALETGIFQRYGFEADYREIIKSSDRLAALASGRVHFGSFGQISMLTSLAHGNRSFYWVGTQDMAKGFEGLVASRGYPSYQQLKGQKVGIPFATSAGLTARLLLKAHGLGEGSVEFVNLDPASIPSALASEGIAAAAVWEPYFSQLQNVEGATLLGVDTETIVHERFGTMTGLDVLLMNKRWLDEDRDRAQRFMLAYWEAVETVRKNPQKAVDAVWQHFALDQNLLEAHLKRFTWLTLDEQQSAMTQSRLLGHTDFILGFLQEIGFIDQIPDYRSAIRQDFLALEKE